MTTKTFLEKQYETLRDEIKETKARVFKILGAGVAVPLITFALLAAVDETHIEHFKVLFVCAPLLVIAVSFWFFYENNAIFRCGEYIREYIEEYIEPPEQGKPFLGWEQWLHNNPRQDALELALHLRFALIMFVDYIASAYLAYTHAHNLAPFLPHWLVTNYIIGGGIVCLYLFLMLRTSTQRVDVQENRERSQLRGMD